MWLLVAVVIVIMPQGPLHERYTYNTQFQNAEACEAKKPEALQSLSEVVKEQHPEATNLLIHLDCDENVKENNI